MAEVHTLSLREESEKPGFCDTPTSRDIINLLTACKHYGLLGVIAGNPGVGKSTATAEFDDRQDQLFGHVYRCRMAKAAQNLQPGLLRIANAVGAHAPANCSAYQLYEAIVWSLELVEQPLLILDESQHMTDELLEAVRDLFDGTGAGVVLVGHRDLEERWSDRASKRRYSYFAQLRGRIRARLTIDAPRKEDLDTIAGAYGVTGQRERKLIATAARHPGKLHMVGNLLNLAYDLAGDGRITLDHLNQAAAITGVSQ